MLALIDPQRSRTHFASFELRAGLESLSGSEAFEKGLAATLVHREINISVLEFLCIPLPPSDNKALQQSIHSLPQPLCWGMPHGIVED